MQDRATIEQVLFKELGRWVVVSGLILFLDVVKLTAIPRAGLELMLGLTNQVAVGMVRTISSPVKMVGYWYQGSKRVADLEERLAKTAAHEAALGNQLTEAQLMEETQQTADAFTSLTVARGRLFKQGSTLVVNRGSREGVATGMVVVDAQGVLVGKITKAGTYMSEVHLPSTLGESVAVVLAGTNSSGAITGDGAAATLSLVSPTTGLTTGDTLVTSGLDDQYPPGLVVGQVTAVTSQAADVSKTASVTLMGKTDSGVVILQ